MSDSNALLSRLPSKDLEYIANGRMDLVSEATLKQLADDNGRTVMNPSVPYSQAEEGARSILNGGTFGFGDEIEAGVRSMFSNRPYESIRDELRARQGQFKADAPEIHSPAELAGGFAIPFGALTRLKGAPQAVQDFAASEKILPQLAKGAAAGAAAGGLVTLGESPDVEEAKKTFGETAFKGGALGATVPLVIRGAGKILRTGLNSFGIGNQSDAAYTMLADRLKKDNLTPEEAQNVLDEMRKVGVPSPVIADLGKSLQDLAQSAYVVPSTAKSSTVRFLEGRLVDQPNAMVSALAEKAGLNRNLSGYEYLTGLVNSQQAAARSAYPKAYSIDVPAEPFRTYVNRDLFSKAYKEAEKRADAYGEKLPPLESLKTAHFIPTEVLHNIKIGLDRVVDAETDSITGKMTGYGSDVAKVKREFNDKIKALNPEYAAANAQFSDAARIKSAFETGQKYQKLDTKEAYDKLKAMNPAEKEAFRLGMMADVNARLENFKGADFSYQIFKSDKQRSMLRYAFDDPAKYDEFVKFASGLEQQNRTLKNVVRGSQTNERTAAGENAGQLAALAQAAASGSPGAVAWNLLRTMAARSRGISGETSEALQRRLFSVDPVEQTAILDEMRRRTLGKPINLTAGSVGVGNVTGLLEK